jgi:hypothetical protein
MSQSLRRRVFGALAGAGLVAGFAGAPAVAHADAASATPGAAEMVDAKGMCEFRVCEVDVDFAMAPPDGTLRVDWADGSVDTYTPGAAEFTVNHTFADYEIDAIPRWTISMSVNGGPATSAFIACTPPVDEGHCAG